MALQLEEQGLQALGKMARPVPGESLTNNPEEPLPFEGPPQYTNTREALDWLLTKLTEENTYITIVGSVHKGIPISDIVQQILYVGFTEGKWNPDMVLLLVEPLMYMIMALCEKAGVQYIIYRGEDEDDEVLDAEENLSEKKDKLKSLGSMVEQKVESSNITSANIPSEIASEIESIEVPEEISLLAKKETTEQNNSLLARG
jgi:hypothetical protein